MLKAHSQIGPFLHPVDPVALNIPNYFEIISHPMDVFTVESKIKNYMYATDEEFNEDLRLIWKNAKIFNSPSTDIYMIAERLEAECENLIQMTQDKLF